MTLRPYYEADGVSVFHADALALSQAQPDASVDLIVTDPPYFRVKDEPWDRAWDSPDTFLAWLGTLLDEWRRILAPNGSLYVFASPDMVAGVERAVGGRFRVLNSVRWIKREGWHNKTEREALRSFLSPWEAIVFAEQHAAPAFSRDASGERRALGFVSPVAVAVARMRESAGIARHEVDSACSPSRKPTGLCYRWEAGDCLPTDAQWLAIARACGRTEPDEALRVEYEALRVEYEALRVEYEALRVEYEALRRPFTVAPNDPGSDLWEFATVAPYSGKHVCEKPDALLSYIVRVSSRPGAVVFDPFVGSGTTARVAMDLGRRAVVGDASAHWCDWTARRLSQLGLFTTEAA